MKIKFLFILLFFPLINLLSQTIIHESFSINQKLSKFSAPVYCSVRIEWFRSTICSNVYLTAGDKTECINALGTPPPCIGLPWWHFSRITYVINNVPMNSLIDVQIKHCAWEVYPNFQFYDVPVRIVQDPSTPIKYDIFAQMEYPNYTNEEYVGYLVIQQETPPSCNYIDDCVSNYAEPSFLLNPLSAEFSRLDGCKVKGDTVPLAYFSPHVKVPNGFSNSQSSNIELCFDKQAQVINFSFNQDNIIPVNYVLSLCEDNLNQKNIRKIFSLSEILNLSASECQDAYEDFVKMRDYEWNLYDGDFIPIEVLMLHEEIHKSDFQAFLSNDFPALINNLRNYKPKCGDFVNIDDAKSQVWFKYKRMFDDYHNNALNTHNKELGFDGKNPELKLNTEQNTHDRAMWLLDEYITALKNHCNI